MSVFVGTDVAEHSGYVVAASALGLKWSFQSKAIMTTVREFANVIKVLRLANPPERFDSYLTCGLTSRSLLPRKHNRRMEPIEIGFMQRLC